MIGNFKVFNFKLLLQIVSFECAKKKKKGAMILSLLVLTNIIPIIKFKLNSNLLLAEKLRCIAPKVLFLLHLKNHAVKYIFVFFAISDKKCKEKKGGEKWCCCVFIRKICLIGKERGGWGQNFETSIRRKDLTQTTIFSLSKRKPCLSSARVTSK